MERRDGAARVPRPEAASKLVAAAEVLHRVHGTGALPGPAAAAVDSVDPTSDIEDPTSDIVPRLWQALREVMDPEIPISVVDLGLIYDIRFAGGTAEVDFSYTAIACPCAHFIQWDIAERLQREPEVTDVRLTEVWNPPWTKARVTAEGRKRLNEMGVSL